MKKYNDFYFAVYDLNDNYICFFETIDEASTLLNMKPFHFYRNLRENRLFIFRNILVRIFPYKKFNINEANYVRSKSIW